eukprot:scaffold30549_cov22-Tisochrysis_lutea.AAC.1
MEIHRQLAATSVPLKGGDAKDAKAWMMHNPKHAILQTQARLNRLARLDRPSPKDQQLSSSPLLQPNGQPLRAPSPMGSAAPVRRMSNQQQQQLQQHAERPSGALGGWSWYSSRCTAFRSGGSAHEILTQWALCGLVCSGSGVLNGGGVQ